MRTSERRIPLRNETGEAVVTGFASPFGADWWHAESGATGGMAPSGDDVSLSDGPIRGTRFNCSDITRRESARYGLRSPRLGVGTGAIGTDAEYIAPRGPSNLETDQTVTAEVRPRFDNPISGVTVTPSGCGLDVTVTEGEVQVTDECTRSGTVEFSINGGQTEQETVSSGIPEVDTQAPALDATATSVSTRTESFQTQGGGGAGDSELTEMMVVCGVTDQPPGVDRVSLAVPDGSGAVVTKTTHASASRLAEEWTIRAVGKSRSTQRWRHRRPCVRPGW